MQIMTCGHEQEMGETVAVKSFTKDGSRAVDFPTLCRECLNRYEKDKQILQTEQDQDNWLNHDR